MVIDKQVVDPSVWCRIVGADHVETGAAVCASWGRRTFGLDRLVSAVLLPGSVNEVAAVMAAASDLKVPVHPVSRGANWGMGSRAPFEDAAAIPIFQDLMRSPTMTPTLALSALSRVWFAALAHFLAGRESEYFIPEIGGSPEASVLANSLDRGDGVMADRWASCSDLEVVLPDGRRLNTGFSALGAHRLAGLRAAAVGPIAVGLFSQSNLGIVVGARVRLAPMPDNLAIVSARIDGLDMLQRTLVIWRDLQRSGAIPDRSVSLWNGVTYLARDAIRSTYADEEVRRAETDIWYLSAYLVAESVAVLNQGRMASGRRRCTAEGAVVRIDELARLEGLLGKPSPRNLR